METKRGNFSQTCVWESLILLMKIKPYDEITMDDISKKSGMSRRTIYRYFDNKLDILKKYIGVLVDEYMDFVTARLRTGNNIVEDSFEFINKHYDFFEVAYKNNLLINIIEILENVIRQVVKFSKTDYFSSLSHDYLESYIGYVAGGCWGILCTWIKEGKKQTPHEMYQFYKQIVKDLHVRLS